ncbi:hypothetical protein [Nonomuraea sp. NPDC049625]|uniref:hypothetical protein n=1 Tax=Nonomuraea sp. NPDC049625 TaxID=3155775 RepID=UPI003441007C
MLAHAKGLQIAKTAMVEVRLSVGGTTPSIDWIAAAADVSRRTGEVLTRALLAYSPQSLPPGRRLIRLTVDPPLDAGDNRCLAALRIVGVPQLLRHSEAGSMWALIV